MPSRSVISSSSFFPLLNHRHSNHTHTHTYTHTHASETYVNRVRLSGNPLCDLFAASSLSLSLSGPPCSSHALSLGEPQFWLLLLLCCCSVQAMLPSLPTTTTTIAGFPSVVASASAASDALNVGCNLIALLFGTSDQLGNSLCVLLLLLLLVIQSIRSIGTKTTAVPHRQ